MKLSASSILVIAALSLLQSSCTFKKKEDLWKEGELATWKFNDQLIIKTEVGQRREHIGDDDFYEPESEHYLGQFPIDYQPKKFVMLTEEEALTMPILPIQPRKALEFNLMLNGSTVQATDRPTYSSEAFDHPDQIKVIISKSDFDFKYLTTKDRFLASLPYKDKYYDENMSKNYGMECYKDKLDFTCFGESSNSQISGLILSSDINPNAIRVVSYEPIYGKIDMEWYIHRDNLRQWKEVDANIWRLLATWNISPITKIQALIDNPRGDLSKTNAKRSNNGKILTFMVTPELIVSANKDETNPYNRSHPDLENFLGQFSIDSIPAKQPISRIGNIKKATTVNEPLEFTFLLNGIEDYHLSSYYTKPSLNQIKVRVTNISDTESSRLETPTERVNYLLSLGDLIIKKESKFYKHGMECYKGENDLFCIGRTNRQKHPELLLQVSSDPDGKNFFLESCANTKMYGGVRVEWKATAESFEDWLAIDAAIWRLLAELNVADIEQN